MHVEVEGTAGARERLWVTFSLAQDSDTFTGSIELGEPLSSWTFDPEHQVLVEYVRDLGSGKLLRPERPPEGSLPLPF